jgi:hypothetical protein
MLELRRWPNGETRVVDTKTNFASVWLRLNTPTGSLAAFALPHDLGDAAAEGDSEPGFLAGLFNRKSNRKSKRLPPLREATIAANSSDAHWLRWDPLGYQVIRREECGRGDPNGRVGPPWTAARPRST